ncbi:Ulp1 protease family, carboxy-terminal domain protein [Sesbania bispinosa]|nr:Ulp1 protease family, carboxy-terminal domain protein [Sesbania bispinosa]
MDLTLSSMLAGTNVEANQVNSEQPVNNNVTEKHGRDSTCMHLEATLQCEMLSQLMGSRSYPDILFKDVLDLFTWEVMDATGLPHIPWGERSAVWVVDWMYMIDSFQPNLSPSMNEKVLRMRVVMDLLCGDHNECWNNLKAKAESFWRSVRHKKIQ